MELEEEILARIRADKAWHKDSKMSDFQFRPFENGSVLVNIKTGAAQLIYDDDSKLHDMQDLHVPKDKDAETEQVQDEKADQK
jgi:hypothetical protein